jgi:hypothetical protein
MTLINTQAERIAKFVQVFKKYLQATDREADLQERQERIELYGRLLSPEGLQQMTELEFGQAISSLWASLMWGNKGYLVERLLEDNPLPELKKQLHEMLWGLDSIASRYDAFRHSVKGFGAATITELLAFTHPDQCGLWNVKARKALILLGFQETFPLVKDSQISGRQYEQYNTLLHEIRAELAKHDLPELDLLGIDYFLFEVWNTGWESAEYVPKKNVTVSPPELTDFDHEEVIEQIITIGQWLGFEVHKEKTVARGARVDAIWQARIANLGVVTYVFEVQRRGSYDSLILNLQRAQNNPTVQRLIVVALQDELNRIRQEIDTLQEGFRRMVGYLDVAEVMRAAELVTELSGIISKLELVKSEFGS